MSQISSALGVDPTASADLPSRFSEMATEDFIRIIFTELTNQDPLQPNDTSALLDQLNSIRSIESDMEMTRKLESLVTENQLASASNMIGKFIGGLTGDFNRVTGYVVSAIRQGDDIFLELDTGWIVPVENVETVIDPTIFGDQTGGGEPEPEPEPDPEPDGDPTAQLTRTKQA